LQASAAKVNAVEAESACAALGGELPTLLALTVFATEPGAQISVGGEWTNQITTLGDEYLGIALLPSGKIFTGSPLNRFHFRCVTPLLA
jgi:hypothetical protein